MSVSASDQQRSPAAERMRRSRRRRRQGLRSVRLAVREAEIKRLLEAGLLNEADRNDGEAIGRAVGRLLDGLPRAAWFDAAARQRRRSDA